MGKVKECLLPEERYEYYIDHRLEGLPLEAISEVASYLHRHWLEYLMFLDVMGAPQSADMLCDDESCKRDFLMYKIHQDISNPNIGLLLASIYQYVENEAYGKCV